MNKRFPFRLPAALFASIVLLLSGMRLSAQTLDYKPEDARSTWTVKASPASGYKVGDVVTLTFTGKPKPDWHLYSAVAGEAYQNTRLDMFDDEGNKGTKHVGGMKDVTKPPHEEDDPIMGGIIRHYNNGQEVSFTQQIRITSPDVNMVGQLAGQCCQDNGQCVPLRIAFKWKFTAAASELPVITPTIDPPVNPGIDTSKKDTVPATIPQGENGCVKCCTEEATASSNLNLKRWPCDITFQPQPAEKAKCEFKQLFNIFIAAFIAGLVAIFTPCVFPIIPLTVSFFTKQSKTRKQGVRNAILYSFCIVFIYVVLGLTLTALFGSQFLYKFSTHPVTNFIFFALLVLFALSFFGWFEITLPSSWAGKLDSQSGRGGIIGIFFMALTLVVVSFSCTGPILGAVVIQAGSAAGGGCFMMPVVGMFGFALALSIPFGLLAIFPGFMNSMPESGGWLNSVKVVLGFLELAFAMKFLSATDLVMGWNLLDRDTFLGIWIILFGMLGMYLLGKLRLPHDSPLESIAVPRLVLAILSFAICAYIFPGIFGKPLPILEGIIPPITPNTGVNIRNAKAGGDEGGGFDGTICSITDRRWLEELGDKDHPSENLCWFFDLCEAADYAQRMNKPLFIDFTGHTCANCRKMEVTVFTTPDVHPYLTDEYVVASLWVDDPTKLDSVMTARNGSKLRTIGDLWLTFEEEIIQQNAQPYYVVMDVKNDTATIMQPPVGYTPNAKEFADYLQKGVDVWKQRHAGDAPATTPAKQH